MVATAKLSNGGAQSYLNLMRNPSPIDLCAGQLATTPQRSCYRMLYSTIRGELQGQNFDFCDQTNGVAPGSLGMANVECDFSVELTDLSEGMVPPGFDVGGGKTLRFWYVTATSTAQIR